MKVSILVLGLLLNFSAIASEWKLISTTNESAEESSQIKDLALKYSDLLLKNEVPSYEQLNFLTIDTKIFRFEGETNCQDDDPKLNTTSYNISYCQSDSETTSNCVGIGLMPPTETPSCI